jgi:hypothetical protein
MKRAFVIALIAFFLLAPYPDRGMAEVRNNPNALRGIQEIDVMVHRLDSRLANFGYSQEQIRADVESTLRMAIIKVLPKALPTLLLDIKSYEFPKHAGLVVLAVRLDLYQFVDLPLSQQVLWNSIWSVETITLSEAPNISRLKENIEELLNKFINDYRSVNPKK